jgi:predicted nucleic acid-binding protein
MRPPVIIDTGPLVAALNSRDNYYHWVVEQLKTLHSPLLTCEAVISETGFLSGHHLHKVNAIFEWLSNGALVMAFQFKEERTAIHKLMVKYTNIPMSFADACLVRMTELYPHSVVLTLDRDFLIYRKHGNQPITTIMPGFS